jgi:hypothetical protein
MALLCVARIVAAQDTPFVFSVTTNPDASKPQAIVLVDVGAGEQTFHAITDAGPEQRFGIQASAGRWTLIGHIGIATAGGEYQTSQQGEALYSLVSQRSAGVTIAVGGGVLHEADGVDVILSRVVAGRGFGSSRLQGNVLFEKPLASNRDAVDLITTVGWARRITRTVSLGVEGVGEDLEGFWDPAEAEGGARVLIGPAIHVAPAHHRWQLSVAGGPTFHPSDNGRSNDAVRDLPPTTRQSGYAVRTSFGVIF